MAVNRFVIGSRSSKLALAQSYYIRDRLKVLYPDTDFQIKTIKTRGDKILDVALSKIGDKGLFTKEIEDALLAGKIDFAVHSMKDLPTQLPADLIIAAVPKREITQDALISKQGFTLSSLPKGAKIGTSSLRRSAQLLSLRNDLNVTDLRGNLDTRLKKLNDGLYEAILLAYAGLKRLSDAKAIELIPEKDNSFKILSGSGSECRLSIIPQDELLPQAGQGALGIEAREDNHKALSLLKVLDDDHSRLTISAERALLNGLEGGCQVPIGVSAQIKEDQIYIRAGVFSLDGKIAIKDSISGSKAQAKALGEELSRKMLEKEAVREILTEIKKGTGY